MSGSFCLNAMVHTVYCLYSLKYDKIYTGCTSNLIQRFYSHNYFSKKGWTTKYRPWIVVYTEYFFDKTEALKREKELKSAKGRRIIREFINSEYS